MTSADERLESSLARGEPCESHGWAHHAPAGRNSNKKRNPVGRPSVPMFIGEYALRHGYSNNGCASASHSAFNDFLPR